MPASIAALPIDPVKKVPVPWFVMWIDGKPEFRIMDGKKVSRCLPERLCWTCGQKLNNRVSFIVGPMCIVNRISGEPPSHPECAAYSVRACPFLSRPNMVRRTGGLPMHAYKEPGFLDRNPGVSCIWTTKRPGAQQFVNGSSLLFEMYPPTVLSFWVEGRPATQEEVDDSVANGLPTLQRMADEQGNGAPEYLSRKVKSALPLFQLNRCTT